MLDWPEKRKLFVLGRFAGNHVNTSISYLQLFSAWGSNRQGTRIAPPSIAAVPAGSPRRHRRILHPMLKSDLDARDNGAFASMTNGASVSDGRKGARRR